MDFKKRFVGRQGFINKHGNIADLSKNEVITLERSTNMPPSKD